MSFQIQDIVLYGPVDSPRILSLKPGQLNIITGASKRGKSALIAIIDYCLGSDECNVAYGPIRTTVEWYGLRLVVGDQHVFVARKAPAKGAESNGGVYFEVSGHIDIPLKTGLSATTNVEAARQLLSRYAGIADNKHQPQPGHSRNAASANIRGALYFCFQSQYEIVNPKLLFYRQGEQFIPQNIQDVLPYFLGAVSDEHLLRIARLRELRQERRRVDQEIAEASTLASQASSRVMSLLSEASALGLVALPDTKLETVGAQKLLREVLERRIEPPPENATTNEYERLLILRDEQVTKLRRLDEDRQAVVGLMSERRGYATEGAEHVSRLKTLRIFGETADEHTCPLCSTSLAGLPAHSELSTILSALQAKLTNVTQESPHLESLAVHLEEQSSVIRTDVKDIRESIAAIERSRQELAAYRESVARTAHVRGRISIYLETIPAAVGSTNTLAGRKASLETQIESLERELGQTAIDERMDSVISLISGLLTEAGRFLDLEHSQYPLRFSAKQLTVVSDTPDGPIPMSKMGSGANWVGYHLAAHLALHKVFVTTKRPVPRFLVLDQPSQVYFPADRDVAGRLEVGREGAAVDDDRAAVLRMFELLRDVVGEMKGQLQIIVTEHADPDVEWFQDSVVERWRDSKALVPHEWIPTPPVSDDSSAM